MEDARMAKMQTAVGCKLLVLRIRRENLNASASSPHEQASDQEGYRNFEVSHYNIHANMLSSTESKPANQSDSGDSHRRKKEMDVDDKLIYQSMN